MTTSNRIANILGARLQIIETQTRMGQLALEEDAPVLAGFWAGQSYKDLDAFTKTMNENLGSLTEWQVSAFHDQFKVLQTQNSDLLAATLKIKLTNTTTKGN